MLGAKRRKAQVIHSRPFRLVVGTQTTNAAWEHNVSLRRRHHSFDVCRSPAVRLILLGHELVLSTFSSLHPSAFCCRRDKATYLYCFQQTESGSKTTGGWYGADFASWAANYWHGLISVTSSQHWKALEFSDRVSSPSHHWPSQLIIQLQLQCRRRHYKATWPTVFLVAIDQNWQLLVSYIMHRCQLRITYEQSIQQLLDSTDVVVALATATTWPTLPLLGVQRWRQWVSISHFPPCAHPCCANSCPMAPAYSAQSLVTHSQEKRLVAITNNKTGFWLPPHTTTTILRTFFRDHPGKLVPDENFWTS